MRARGLALLAWIAVVAGAGCSPPTPPDARPVVAVSVLPFASFVTALAGDRVSVEVMIPPGANPATHEPTLPQVQRLARAVLFVKVGHPRFPFESAWLGRLLADRPDLPVVDASAGLEAPGDDPHVWVSPRRIRALAPALAEALGDVLPDEREALRDALARFEAELDADAELGAVLGPARGRRFLVYHPAWGHLAAEHGLVQLSIEREGKEPDPRALARRVAEARAAGISVVFAQPQFDAASARVVAEEIGARVELLDPLAPDWADNLRRVARALAAGAVP